MLSFQDETQKPKAISYILNSSDVPIPKFRPIPILNLWPIPIPRYFIKANTDTFAKNPKIIFIIFWVK